MRFTISNPQKRFVVGVLAILQASLPATLLAEQISVITHRVPGEQLIPAENHHFKHHSQHSHPIKP